MARPVLVLVDSLVPLTEVYDRRGVGAQDDLATVQDMPPKSWLFRALWT